MNVYGYVDEYGIYSFKEREFNEVDAAIFSFLAYANFKGIIGKEKITIKEAGRKHIGLSSSKKKEVIAVKEGNKLLKYLKDSKRYEDCLIYNYEYEGNEDIQFGAISIEYQKNKVFVAYEGTDELFSGWKENFYLSYIFPTVSHKKAIAYLNKHFTFSKKNIIVGGHSKGGNLALVAGAYGNFWVRRRISSIYNFDGPGLLEKEFQSIEYTRILDKYQHVIPNYSVVGLLLNNSNDIVVKASNRTILSHSIVYWKIRNNYFERGELSSFSQELKKEINAWVNRYSKEEKETFINNLEEICKKNNIHSFGDIMDKKVRILDFIYSSKDFNSTTKKILSGFVNLIVKCFNQATKDEVKKLLSTKMN